VRKCSGRCCSISTRTSASVAIFITPGMINGRGNSAQPIRTTAQSGIANCGPLFLTLPTILFTGQIFSVVSAIVMSLCAIADITHPSRHQLW
jgi:hypothetical protein